MRAHSSATRREMLPAPEAVGETEAQSSCPRSSPTTSSRSAPWRPLPSRHAGGRVKSRRGPTLAPLSSHKCTPKATHSCRHSRAREPARVQVEGQEPSSRTPQSKPRACRTPWPHEPPSAIPAHGGQRLSTLCHLALCPLTFWDSSRPLSWGWPSPVWWVDSCLLGNPTSSLTRRSGQCLWACSERARLRGGQLCSPSYTSISHL